MTGPSRRDVERAIERYRETDRLGDEDGAPSEAKLLVGIDLTQFALPEDAAENVERAGSLDTSAPVIVSSAEDAPDALRALSLPDAGREAGFEAETLLADAQAAESETGED